MSSIDLDLAKFAFRHEVKRDPEDGEELQAWITHVTMLHIETYRPSWEMRKLRMRRMH